jgi:hypothetical protein
VEAGLTEPLGDVRADLGPEAQRKAAGRVAVELVGLVRHHHRVADERDRDGRAEPQPGGVLGCQCQRQERLGAGLQRPQAFESGLLGRDRHLAGVGQAQPCPWVQVDRDRAGHGAA